MPISAFLGIELHRRDVAISDERRGEGVLVTGRDNRRSSRLLRGRHARRQN